MVEINYKRQLFIDVVLQIRIAKYFLRNPNKLTIEKIKKELSSQIDFDLYDFNENETYYIFTLNDEIVKDELYSFLLFQLILFNHDFKDKTFKQLEEKSIHDILNTFSDNELLSSNCIKCPIYFSKEKSLYFNYDIPPGKYEIEISTINYYKSSSKFNIEGSSYALQYLKNLIELPYFNIKNKIGKATLIHYDYLEK